MKTASRHFFGIDLGTSSCSIDLGVRVLAPGWRRGSEVVVPPRVELVD